MRAMLRRGTPCFRRPTRSCVDSREPGCGAVAVLSTCDVQQRAQIRPPHSQGHGGGSFPDISAIAPCCRAKFAAFLPIPAGRSRNKKQQEPATGTQLSPSHRGQILGTACYRAGRAGYEAAGRDAIGIGILCGREVARARASDHLIMDFRCSAVRESAAAAPAVQSESLSRSARVGSQLAARKRTHVICQ